MNRIKAAAAACLACAVVAVAPAVHAEGEGNGIGRSSAPGRHMGTFHGAQAATRALLAALHDRLGITSAQEAAWTAFANAVMTQAADADGAAMQGATVANAVDALNLQATVLHKQADDATAVAQSFTALYALLTPSQRTLVNSYFEHGPMF